VNRTEMIQLLALLDEQERRKPCWLPMRSDPNRPDIVLPQGMAFDTKASIVGYGGSAGGGKTDVAIGMALLKSERSIIYRRQFPHFEAITSRFNDILGKGYVKANPTYMVEPPTGTRGITAKRILFGSLDNERKDVDKYQGKPYDHIFFDEVTQFQRDTVEYLMQWNRSTNPNQNCKVVMTFNPPTRPEGLWVKDYFAPWLNKSHHLYGKVESGQVLHRVAIPTADGQSSTFHYFDEAQTVTHNPVTGQELKRPLPTRSITFIRSRLSDNLYLRDTDYEAALLGSSDPNMARVMLDGDFDVDFKDGILSVFKPQHWQASIERFKRLEQMPTGVPDVVSIDAAKGGDDDMVVQLGYRVVEQGQPTKYIYPQALKVRGGLVSTHELQWQWVIANVPHLLDARLFVIDIVGGAGETLAAYIENEVQARHGRKKHVIRFKGGANSNWRSIHDWDTGKSSVGAMSYANDITAAWHTASAAQQHTETCIFPDDELQRQCLSRNFQNTDANYQLEPKERFSQRLGRSPDNADAYCMAAIGLHRYLSTFGR
jgi:hypothetical protein